MSVAVVAVPVTTVWTAPDAARPIDTPMVADRPYAGGWTTALGHDERLDLLGRVVTQALLGEPVDVREERAGWASIVLPAQPFGDGGDGYPGWVRLAHLTGEPANGGTGAGAGAAAAITVRLVSAMRSDGSSVVLSYGTRLPVATEVDTEVASDAERVRLRAPDGTTLEVPGEAVAPVAPSGPGVLAAARVFTGLDYLWGGCSGWSVDCSGLAHLVHRAAGLTIPRDAGDQSRSGTAVPVAEAQAGDLLFFTRPGDAEAHHVALCSGPGRMLHSPRTGLAVQEGESGVEPYRSELEPLARRYTTG